MSSAAAGAPAQEATLGYDEASSLEVVDGRRARDREAGASEDRFLPIQRKRLAKLSITHNFRRELHSEDDICQTCEPAPHDDIAWWRVTLANNGIGAVAGGLGGVLVGSKIAGRSNHTLGGVIGAVGGGLLGNAIESHERGATMYDVRVRMADGSIRTVRQSNVPNVGQRVNVDGNTLRAIDGQG